MNKTSFAFVIIDWYERQKRDLPWRHTKDPYFIWLSEIILQQTRVKQGLPYYQKFIQRFPTIESLAKAEEQDVLRLWQGLGYYSRARNMHYTARYITDELEGEFPGSYQKLLKLKGIGKYTAAAIASFAFEEKVAVLDGNVFRVLARFFGIETDIASTQGMKEFSALAQSLLPAQNSDSYNQGIMEFGAMQCTPVKPHCMYCPLQGDCQAFSQGKQSKLPVKIKRITSKQRFFHYLIFHHKNHLVLKKREAKDIWEGLYDFILVEENHLLSTEALLQMTLFKNLPNSFILEKESGLYKHTLSHQKIHAKFWHIQLPDLPAEWEQLKKAKPYSLEEIQHLPKPVLIQKYLQKYFF